MNYNEIKKSIIQISDPVEKLEFVMELGQSLPKIPNNALAHEISGCASKVLIYKSDDNHFFASADSALVRGLVAILLSAIQGKSLPEIKKMNLFEKFNALNLNLGAGRLNGVSAIIEFLENE